MLRPTLPEDRDVQLVFEEPVPPIRLETDRAKLSQIMRNLISNALKFTDRGEVRVSAKAAPDGMVAISVADPASASHPPTTTGSSRNSPRSTAASSAR